MYLSSDLGTYLSLYLIYTTVQTFISPVAGTLDSIYINPQPPGERSVKRDESFTVQLLDSSNNILGSDTVTTSGGSTQFTFNVDILAQSIIGLFIFLMKATYKFKVSAVSGWSIQESFYSYQDGAVEGHSEDLWFVLDISCNIYKIIKFNNLNRQYWIFRRSSFFWFFGPESKK